MLCRFNTRCLTGRNAPLCNTSHRRRRGHPPIRLAIGVSGRQPQLGDAITTHATAAAGKFGVQPTPISPSTVRSQYTAASLAFLGDAVWEVFIRQHYFGSGTQALHAYNLAVKQHAGALQQVGDMGGCMGRVPWGNVNHESILPFRCDQAIYYDQLVSGAGRASSSQDDGDSNDDSGSAEGTSADSAGSPASASGNGADSGTPVAGSRPESPGGEAALGSPAAPSAATEVVQPPASTTRASGDGGGGGGVPLVPPLSAQEQDVLRWARNSSAISAPRGMDSLQYKKATAVEVLVGHE
jgi:23S rRNA maturation mini-RNase III